MSVNKAILVGNVGNDPEVRYLENGTAVCRFPMATNENYTNKNGERVTQTEWHNVVLWRKLAEVAEKFIKKGTQVYIEGRIKTRAWDDKEGNKRYTTEIVGDVMQLLGKREDSDYSGSNNQSPGNDSSSQQPANTGNQNQTASKPGDTGEDTGGMENETDDLPF